MNGPELNGYTGFGIYLIAAVFGFNLLALLAWFVLGALRRTHDTSMLRIETFLSLMHDRKDKPTAELQAALDDLQQRYEKASSLGPLWGRKFASSAELARQWIVENYDEAQHVDQRMEL